ncbi:MAG: hypothetical protein GEU80_05440 [Dehalococcoidia bacterium]|nr:hypothetical protein [Dehalococcoidia bacterium]
MAGARDLLLSLIDYDEWAAGRVLAAAARCTPEELDRPSTNPDWTVLSGLVHITSAYTFWERTLGLPVTRLDPGALRDVASVRALADEVRRTLHGFVSARDDEALGQLVRRLHDGDPPIAAWLVAEANRERGSYG